MPGGNVAKEYACYAKLAEGLDYYSGKLMCSEERGEGEEKAREGERELGTLVTSQVSSEDEIAIGWEKLACRMPRPPRPPPRPKHACAAGNACF